MPTRDAGRGGDTTMYSLLPCVRGAERRERRRGCSGSYGVHAGGAALVAWRPRALSVHVGVASGDVCHIARVHVDALRHVRVRLRVRRVCSVWDEDS